MSAFTNIPGRRRYFGLFIEIASRLVNRYPNLFFAIFGDGPDRQQLEKQASLQLPPKSCKFFGHLPKVDSYYSLFDIFCYTSLPFEGMPNVIMEASASGIPVVASAVDEVPYIVENEKTGYLVNDFKAESFVEKLLSLLEDKNKRELFGEAGRRRMDTLFSVTSMTNEMINIYTNNN